MIIDDTVRIVKHFSLLKNYQSDNSNYNSKYYFFEKALKSELKATVCQ